MDRQQALVSLFCGDDGRQLPIVASVFTPYQLLQFERILSLLPTREVLLIDGRPRHFREGRPPKVSAASILAADLTGKVIDAGQAKLVRKLMSDIDAFANGRPFAFICASFQRHLNTVAYTRYCKDSNVHLLLMDDGLSTFLDPRLAPRERVKNVMREAVARFIGYPKRRWVAGHPLGLDAPEVKGIILSLDCRPSNRKARKYFLLPESREVLPAGDPAAALFIGQPYEAVYGRKLIVRLIEAIAKDLHQRGFTTIAFKPHHFQTPKETELYLQRGFTLVNPPIPVEEMIAASEFRTIASINTTALLTGKALFGDSIESIAYSPSAFKPPQEQRDLDEVEALFKRAGVELVDLRSVIEGEPH